MMRLICAAVAAACLLAPEAALAKKFNEHDKSNNNPCDYVHSWYMKAKGKHAVYVSTGGVAYGAPITKVGRCQAGDGPRWKRPRPMLSENARPSAAPPPSAINAWWWRAARRPSS